MHGLRIPCLALFLLAIAACGEERRPAHQPKPASDIPEPRDVTKRWQVVRVGTLLKFEAERALYERAGSEHFFVRLRMTNLGANPVGIDLRDYWLMPRPNQWGGLRTDTRGEINESRLALTPLDAERRKQLLSAFDEGALTRVAGGATVDVYVEFNASGRADVDAVDLPYLYVSLDGQLIATDGKAFENLTLAWNDDDEDRPSSVIIPAPFPWGSVPEGAVVVVSP